MSDNHGGPLPAPPLSGGFLIPCSPEDFGQFISRLLGKPQISRGRFPGSFSVGFEEIENFHLLLHQRITEQNKGQLVQFTISVKYDDGTSVEFPSLDHLKNYSEVRPIISTGVTMSWVYLVGFKDSKFPEKQQIEV